MKCLRFLPLLLLPLFFAGCGTVTQQDRQVLRDHEVSTDVYDTMLYGDPLSPDEVIELSQRAVPPGLIIRYLDRIDEVFQMPKAEVKRMRAAGVDEQVIAYMLSTAPQYGPGPYGPYPGPYAGPYPYGYPYGYYGGPVVVVGGGYGWYHGGGWGHGGWGGGGWGHHH